MPTQSPRGGSDGLRGSGAVSLALENGRRHKAERSVEPYSVSLNLVDVGLSGPCFQDRKDCSRQGDEFKFTHLPAAIGFQNLSVCPSKDRLEIRSIQTGAEVRATPYSTASAGMGRHIQTE